MNDQTRCALPATATSPAFRTRPYGTDGVELLVLLANSICLHVGRSKMSSDVLVNMRLLKNSTSRNTSTPFPCAFTDLPLPRTWCSFREEDCVSLVRSTAHAMLYKYWIGQTRNYLASDTLSRNLSLVVRLPSCPVSCGQCGGSGCSSAPGGKESCCTSTILEAGDECGAPPCVIGGEYTTFIRLTLIRLN